MARSYSNIMCAIWKDADFLRLPEREQRLYFLLVTQPEISSCGTLPITLKRWAKYSADSLLDALSDSLSGLSEHGYVIIDWELEELLVRSFIRHDQGFANIKRLPSILAAAKAVASSPLQQVIADELDRLNVAHDLRNSLSNRASDRASDSPRSVVTLGSNSTTHNPQTTINTHEPGDAPQATPPPRATRGQRIPDDFHITDSMKEWATKTVPGMDLDFHTQKFRNHWESQPGSKALKLDWVKTWQNWLMNDFRPTRAESRPPTRTDRFQASLALAAELAEEQRLSDRLEIAQ